MNRTNIIDDDEVARAMALASPAKGKGKGKKKATEPHASSPSKPKNINAVPAASASTNGRPSATPATADTPVQGLEARYYEANGLKIPLYNKDGLGNKKKQYARLSKGLLKYSVDELLDVVEQYAGADKKKELKDKGLTKTRLANWIEEKETMALGRNPKSTLLVGVDDDDDQEADDADHVASFLASTTQTPSDTKTQKHANTSFVSSTKTNESMAATKHHVMSDQPSQRKRSAPDGLPDGQRYAKLQERDAPTNQDATSTGHSAKKYFIDKSVNDIVPTPSQTARQTKVYKDKDSELDRQNAFVQSTGMSPFDPDHSSMIIRGNREDRILTATQGQGIRTYETYLHETTIPRNTTEPPKSPSVPYLKDGKHGRQGDFLVDDCRRTGVGHQIEPDDHLKWIEFQAFRASLYEQFPRYPKFIQGDAVEIESKDAWDAWQIWYEDFTKKYPGYAVAHLWPCGCEKVREEDESEEE